MKRGVRTGHFGGEEEGPVGGLVVVLEEEEEVDGPYGLGGDVCEELVAGGWERGGRGGGGGGLVVGVGEEHLQAGDAAVPGGLLGDVLKVEREFVLLFSSCFLFLVEAEEEGSEGLGQVRLPTCEGKGRRRRRRRRRAAGRGPVAAHGAGGLGVVWVWCVWECACGCGFVVWLWGKQDAEEKEGGGRFKGT